MNLDSAFKVSARPHPGGYLISAAARARFNTGSVALGFRPRFGPDKGKSPSPHIQGNGERGISLWG